MSDGGKGSKPRPYSVDKETFDNRWDAIFKQPDTSKIGDKIVKQVENSLTGEQNETGTNQVS